MIQASFAAIGSTARDHFLRRVCAFVTETVAKGRNVAIVVSDGTWAAKIDSMLWTFDPGSFVPHSRLGDETSSLDRVIIVEGNRRVAADVFVNFTQEPLNVDPSAELERSIEILEFVRTDDPASLATGRTKWNAYREMGVETRRWNFNGG